MRELMMALSGLCVIAALCEQLVHGNRFKNSLRMVLGLEMTWTLMELLKKSG